MANDGIVGKIKAWINEEDKPENKLEHDATDMLLELEGLSEATSFAMARADDKYDALTSALARDEALSEEAEEMMRAGDEDAARRCLALRLENDKRMKDLQADYQALQNDAEQKAQTYLSRRDEIEVKVQKIPELQEDAKMIAQQENMDKRFSKFSLEGAERSFDQAAREIEMKKKQLTNRQMLMTDPNAEVDRRIETTMRERAVDKALEGLKLKMASDEPKEKVEYVEGEVVDGDAATQARQLLEAPRYKGILPQKSGAKVRR